MRIETLSNDEGKVIDAIRLIAKTQESIQKNAAQQGIQTELEDIYHNLTEYEDAYDPRAMVDECARRIYNLLH